MICWSCEKSVSDAPFCSACNAILPLAGRANHFELLGAPQQFSQDMPALQRAYKDAARAVHPDKFARADARARRAAMQRTVALNEAWRTLRDPVARAEYLLRQNGIEVGAESGTLRTTAAGQEKLPVPAELLTEMLGKREALMEAQLDGDAATVARLEQDMQAQLATDMAQVAEALDVVPPQLDAAARALVAIRYRKRFLHSVHEHGAEAPGAHHG